MSLRSFLMLFMSPETKKKAEAETRGWIAPCRNCGAAVSLWDVGGIRYRSTDGRKSTIVRCPKCEKIGPFTFTRTK